MKIQNIKACVFDAYGTLFDVNSAAAKCKKKLGNRWEGFANAWRTTQLEYTWIRSLMKKHKNFWEITEDSLDHTMETFKIKKEMKNELLNLYKELSPYPEVKECLEGLKSKKIKIKKKLKNLIAIFSSAGPISVTRLDRENDKGKDNKELKANHKIIRKINKKFTIYCSPGHFKKFLSNNKKYNKKLKKFLFKHQVKKKFQYSLEWEKNQLAIWDNRSMLHQATPFKGTRIMHRITIQ